MLNKKIENTDLAALFDLEMDAGADTVLSDTGIASVTCDKCHGRGNFIGYSGRVIGKCFACGGTGLKRHVGVALKEGDCPKCLGTGEWNPGRPCFACNGTGKELIGADIDVGAIEIAFASARDKGIKTPKLRLDSFIFSRAPDTGRNAGSIYVKEDGTYLGKIAAGKFTATGACDESAKARVIAAAANPHESAKAYGLRTGSCSCCGRELTNGLSIDLGIGPICREKFGWG